MRNTSAIAIAAACLLALATPAFADVNLIPNLPTGWSWPLVPRPASDATLTSVPLPLTLTGYTLQKKTSTDSSKRSRRYEKHLQNKKREVIILPSRDWPG